MYIRLLQIVVLLALVVTVVDHSHALAAHKTAPRELIAVIQADFDGFNSNNFALSNSQYGSEVVILDSFPPYRWQGAEAHAQWWADFRSIAKEINATGYHSSFKEPTDWEESNGRAFVTFPEIFAWTAGGKTYTENLICMDVLTKNGTAWKIIGVACNQLSVTRSRT